MNLKSWMICVVLFASIFSGHANSAIKQDAEADQNELTWHLPEPATHVYQVEYVSKETKGDVEKQLRVTSRTKIETRSTNAGIIQEWRDSDAVRDYVGYDAEHKKMLDGMFKAAENIPIKVALSEDGAYKSVLNIAEWTTLFKTEMDKLLSAVQADALEKIPAEKRAEAKVQIEKQTSGLMAAITSPAFVQKQLEKIPFAYNFFNGGGLDPEKAYELEASTENPFGGVPFPVKIHFEITLDEKDPGFVYAFYKSSLDQEKGRPAFAAAMKQLIGKDDAGIDVEIDKQLKEFEITTTANLRISLKTGAVDYMEYTETKKFPGSLEITTTEMTLDSAVK